MLHKKVLVHFMILWFLLSFFTDISVASGKIALTFVRNNLVFNSASCQPALLYVDPHVKQGLCHTCCLGCWEENYWIWNSKVGSFFPVSSLFSHCVLMNFWTKVMIEYLWQLNSLTRVSWVVDEQDHIRLAYSECSYDDVSCKDTFQTVLFQLCDNHFVLQ